MEPKRKAEQKYCLHIYKIVSKKNANLCMIREHAQWSKRDNLRQSKVRQTDTNTNLPEYK